MKSENFTLSVLHYLCVNLIINRNHVRTPSGGPAVASSVLPLQGAQVHLAVRT